MSQALTRLQLHLIDAVQGKKDRGATMVEYGIMVALIAAVCIVTIGLIGGQVEKAFTDVQTAL